MHLARVVAKVIANQKSSHLVGGALLLIKAVDENKQILNDEPPYVAIDRVGAGVGNCVLVEWGGSYNNNLDMVGDMAIVGIVDEIQGEPNRVT